MTALTAAITTVPPGRWAVGVSGGADSVALLRRLAERADCEVVVAHLDHQLRGEESDADAAFVAALAKRLRLPCEMGLRAEWSSPPPLEGGGGGRGPQGPSPFLRGTVSADPSPPPSPSRGGGANASARYRAARFAFFTDVVRRHDCQGVLLAHHADDQAETVLLRLARGRSLAGLGGMETVTAMDGLVVRRPLLGVRRDDLRAYLTAIGQPWREDASNASPKYRRNVFRAWLSGPLPREYAGEGTGDLVSALLRLAEASRRWRVRLDTDSPALGDVFDCRQLRNTSLPFAEHAVRRWLVERGAPPDRVSPTDCRRLVEQAIDVSKPSRQHYPGGLLVRRRGGRVDVIPSPPLQSPTTHGQEATRAQNV